MDGRVLLGLAVDPLWHYASLVSTSTAARASSEFTPPLFYELRSAAPGRPSGRDWCPTELFVRDTWDLETQKRLMALTPALRFHSGRGRLH